MLAVAAVAAFSLTACQGDDKDDASAPEKSASSAASPSAGKGGAEGGTEGGGSQTPAGAKSDAPAAKESSGTSDSAGTDAPDSTEKLADGSTAEIYKLGDTHYKAKIVNDGDVLGEMETNGEDAAMDANGMFVLLAMDGKIYSWMGNSDTGPGTFVLEGDWQAEVSKIGDGHFRAEISGHDGVVATLETKNGNADGVYANGIPIVLTAMGEISSQK
ncbi:hypothetical protein [Streptomyces sp. NA04227]|uniref:hypothetical protein n=1 Tax=Streptomyces sp. NA04227 TaxID=2742136 RepID=UPI0020CA5492|nr:hypothetical protein [Streptomyces sp. NA04227]